MRVSEGMRVSKEMAKLNNSDERVRGRYTLYTHARPCTPNLYNQYSFTVVHGGADARLDRNAHANLAAASYMGIARAM